MNRHGLTLIELMVCVTLLVVGITALLGAFLSQMALNEHARNMAWAMNDANRVMERMRQLNVNCDTPSAAAPSECGDGNDACADWNDWLADTAEGKSIEPDPDTYELITMTSTGTDPLQVTVAVCWRHKSRVIGECTWDAGTETFDTDDVDGDGIIESPAMLSTLMTCRSES
ncbi:MAG: prepilin-type N-terminal cleavage/methylation domain-containing protein [Candidatus Omnitrophica bacterium]|nr:prepilin-type N-terminal cleavage/methylation domain-containing protein [Candidatus Omnitrophota bacterium]